MIDSKLFVVTDIRPEILKYSIFCVITVGRPLLLLTCLYCFIFMHWLWFDYLVQTWLCAVRALIDSQLLCRQPLDHRLSPLTGRSQTLCIRDCCWQGCSVPPNPDERIPYQRDISFPLLYLEASPPAGWLWTVHHVSTWHKDTWPGQPPSLTTTRI